MSLTADQREGRPFREVVGRGRGLLITCRPPSDDAALADLADELGVDKEQQPKPKPQRPEGMPRSWQTEDAALWQQLPPELQAKAAEREERRERGVRQNLDEVAALHKAVE